MATSKATGQGIMMPNAGRGYRPQSNYGGSSYNSAFSDGYYQGYEVGYYDAKNRGTYNLR